jgi:hypothetical protein
MRRHSRGGAAGLRPTPARVAFAVATLVIVVAVGADIVSSDDRSAASGGSPATTASPTAASRPEICSDRRVTCLDLGGVAWGVRIPGRSGGSAGSGAVVWERGGPGAALPVDAATALNQLPEFVRDHDVLLVSEPWERRPPDRPCLAAVGVQTRELLDTAATTSSADTDACRLADLWWTAGSYRDAVTTLATRLGVPVRGFYADSFGAVKVAWVRDLVRAGGGWSVLHAPAPVPRAVTAAELLRQRAQLVADLVTRDFAGLCPAHAWACQIAAADLLDPRRDTPVSGPDLASASIWASYDSADNKDRLWDAVDRAVTGDATALRKLAYAASYRSGPDAVFPNLVGYLAGICQTYGEWPPVRSPSAGSVAETIGDRLARMHHPCRSVRGPATSTAVPTGGCVVLNRSDPVVPEALAATWAVGGNPGRTSYYSYPGHIPMPADVAKAVSDKVGKGECAL